MPKGATPRRNPPHDPAPAHAAAPVAAAPPDAPAAFEPLKPQRTLFRVLCAVLAVWLACLVAMYFLTIRPQKQAAPPAEPVVGSARL